MKQVKLKKNSINFLKKADRLKDIIFRRNLKQAIKVKVRLFVMLDYPFMIDAT